jgi:hypothetical protein
MGRTSNDVAQSRGDTPLGARRIARSLLSSAALMLGLQLTEKNTHR